MRFFPDLETFRQLVRGHDTVPVYREVAADLDTPVSAFLKLHRSGQQGFLLEECRGRRSMGALQRARERSRHDVEDPRRKDRDPAPRRALRDATRMRAAIRCDAGRRRRAVQRGTRGGSQSLCRRLRRLSRLRRGADDRGSARDDDRRPRGRGHRGRDRGQLHSFRQRDAHDEGGVAGARRRRRSSRCGLRRGGRAHRGHGRAPDHVGRGGATATDGRVPAPAVESDARGIRRRSRERSRVHSSRRRHSGRDLAALRATLGVASVLDLSRAAHHQSVSLHVLSRPRRRGRRRRIAGDDGEGRRSRGLGETDRRHHSARRECGRGRAADPSDARRSKGASGAHHAARPRAQRHRARRRDRQRARRRADDRSSVTRTSITSCLTSSGASDPTTIATTRFVRRFQRAL